MAEYSVGPGIAQSIADNGDVARSNEETIISTPHRVARVYGQKAEYLYFEEDNRVVRLPFEAA